MVPIRAIIILFISAPSQRLLKALDFLGKRFATLRFSFRFERNVRFGNEKLLASFAVNFYTTWRMSENATLKAALSSGTKQNSGRQQAQVDVLLHYVFVFPPASATEVFGR